MNEFTRKAMDLANQMVAASALEGFIPDGFRTARALFIAHLEGGEKKWISVDERLPAVDERCIYYFDVVGMHIGMHHGGGNFGGRSGFLGGREVTHWMPLPATPTEESP